MTNLKVFDLKNNPLECNDEFRNLMKFLGTRKVSFPTLLNDKSITTCISR